MSKKADDYRIDDLIAASEGAEVKADQTLMFSFDGTSFEIDLTDQNAARFRDMMRPYADVARKIRKKIHPRRTAAGRRRSKAIREWAKDRYVISDRGRIPNSVIRDYEREQLLEQEAA